MHDPAHLRIDLQPHHPHGNRDRGSGFVVGIPIRDTGQSGTRDGDARRTFTLSGDVPDLEPAGRTQRCVQAGLR
jgi:hypothetical protein